jgi:hypothetical protein
MAKNSMAFTDGAVCRSRDHCGVCRELGARGRRWRTSQMRTHATPGDVVDFECPVGRPWLPPEKPQRRGVPMNENPKVDMSIAVSTRYPLVMATIRLLDPVLGANKAALAVLDKALAEKAKKPGCASCAAQWQSVVVRRYDELHPRLDFSGIVAPPPPAGPGESIPISVLAPQANG